MKRRILAPTLIVSFSLHVYFCFNTSQIEVEKVLKHKTFLKDGPYKPLDGLIFQLWKNKVVFSKCTDVHLQVYSPYKFAAYCTTWIYGEIPKNLTQENYFAGQLHIDVCSCVEISNNSYYCKFWQCGGSAEENHNTNMTNGIACICREESKSSNYCQMWQCIEQKQHLNGTKTSAYQQYQCTNGTDHYCTVWEGETKTQDRHKTTTCKCTNAPTKIIYLENEANFSGEVYCQEWKCDEQDDPRDYEARFILTIVAAVLNALFFLSVGFCAADEYPRMFFSRLVILFTVGSVCIAICTVAGGLLGCFIGLASNFVGFTIYIAIFAIMPPKV